MEWALLDCFLIELQVVGVGECMYSKMVSFVILFDILSEILTGEI